MPDHQAGLRAHWKALAACTLVSMSPFQYGLDFGIVSGLQAMVGFLEIFGERDPAVAIGWNISAERQQLISSLMVLGAFASSCTAGLTARWVGRKLTLGIACLLVVVSVVLMQVTTSIGCLYFARLLIGLANGLLMTHSQLYIQECSPAKYRGLMISVFQYWTSIGTLIGTIVDNFSSKIDGRKAYVIPLGIVYIVPGLLCLGMLVIPESPRWLMQKGHREKAEKALRWLRPKEWSIDQEMIEIQAALEAENELAGQAAIKDMFTNPIDRRRTVLSVAGVSVQAASGAMYMISYGTYFFEMANIGNSFENSCILTAVGVVAILINSAVITKIGRRRVFMIAGLTLCGISQIIIAAVYTKYPGTVTTGKVIVGLSVIYILGYNGCIASYAWLSGGEMPSQRLRSYTFGLASGIGFLGAWLATFTAPYFINPDALNWGPKYGYIWAPSCWLTAIWLYLFFPEVKGRTLEEIDELFEARIPARKFRKYQCIGRVAAAAKVESQDYLDHDRKSSEAAVWTERKSTEERVWSDPRATSEATATIA